MREGDNLEGDFRQGLGVDPTTFVLPDISQMGIALDSNQFNSVNIPLALYLTSSYLGKYSAVMGHYS